MSVDTLFLFTLFMAITLILNIFYFKFIQPNYEYNSNQKSIKRIVVLGVFCLVLLLLSCVEIILFVAGAEWLMENLAIVLRVGLALTAVFVMGIFMESLRIIKDTLSLVSSDTTDYASKRE